MEKMKVRDLMRPIDVFLRISVHATLAETIDALNEAEKQFLAGHVISRLVIVYDDAGDVVGKMSPIDVVQGLEPSYDSFDFLKGIPHHYTPPSTVEYMKESLRFWQKPLSELCRKATHVKISDFIKPLTPDRVAAADDRMDVAFHLLLVSRQDSVFVTDGGHIIGILRFFDVYKKILQTMRECKLPE